MLFIYPMWDSETQRNGKKKCTPLDYALNLIAELFGFLGLAFFLAYCPYLVFSGYCGTFRISFLWLLTIPFALGVIAEAVHWYSWHLTGKKGFKYDYTNDEASWIENGMRRVYKWEG